MKKFFTLWVSMVLLFSGCAIKKYAINEPKLVILKTPKLRFSDTGYIRRNGDALQLELYSSGIPVKRFEMNHLMCVDEGCMSKSHFNATYLSAYYPDDLLLHVSQGMPLFEGVNLTKTSQGYEQHIVSDVVDIIYRVSDQETYFKDSKNNILIRLKALP
jgi:hypothetical protein